jgi:hypothetical protein
MGQAYGDVGSGKPSEQTWSTGDQTQGGTGRWGPNAYERGTRLRSKRRAKDMLLADVNTMNKTPWALGMTDAQKQEMVDQAQQTAGMQAASQQAELERQTMAAGSGLQAGYLQEASRGIADESGKAGAAASAQANLASRQLIEQRSAEIRGRLAGDVQQAIQSQQYWTDKGFEALGAAESGARFLGDAGLLGGDYATNMAAQTPQYG